MKASRNGWGWRRRAKSSAASLPPSRARPPGDGGSGWGGGRRWSVSIVSVVGCGAVLEPILEPGRGPQQGADGLAVVDLAAGGLVRGFGEGQALDRKHLVVLQLLLGGHKAGREVEPDLLV